MPTLLRLARSKPMDAAARPGEFARIFYLALERSMASGSDPRTFFESLWSGLKGGHAAVTAFHAENDRFKPDGPRFFAWPNHLDAFLARSRTLAEAGAHAYFSIGLRQRASPEAAYIFAVPALWVTFNTAAVTVDQAVETLKRFPFKASAGVLGAHALDVYWFLNEAMAGDELRLVWSLNMKLRKAFFGVMNDAHYDPFLTSLGGGYQAEHYDAAGLLRVPGSSDPSAGPAAPVEIVSWNFDVRHSLVDIYELLTAGEEPVPPPAASVPTATVEPGPSPEPPAVTVSSSAVGRELSPELVDRTAEHLKACWIEGLRESILRPVMESLALSDIAMLSALRIIKAVCALRADPNEPAYNAFIQETYRRRAVNDPQLSWASVNKQLDEMADIAKGKIKKLVDAIRKSVPPDDGGGEDDADQKIEANFESLRLISFPSNPQRHVLYMKSKEDGREFKVSGETDTIFTYGSLQKAAWEQTAPKRVVLAPIKQFTWLKILESTPTELRPALPEATTDGAIDNALEEFLQESKENPDIGLLKTFPGYDSAGHFFRYEAFRDFMRQNTLKISDREVYDRLKTEGWEPGSRRFGNKVRKVWLKAPQNGNGTSKDASPVQETPPKMTPTRDVDPQSGLFGPGVEGA